MMIFSENKRKREQEEEDCENLLQFLMQTLYDDRYNGKNIKIKNKSNKKKGG